MAYAGSHIRIARPCRDLAVAERFWVGGLGLEVLHRGVPGGNGQAALLMVGWPGAAWHLELTAHPTRPVEPCPSPEDLLVVYLNGEVPAELVSQLENHGGHKVTAHNPYWDAWGVTMEDPDGYRLVLCTRDWSNVPASM